LLTDMLRARGYPLGESSSVSPAVGRPPRLAENYRVAAAVEHRRDRERLQIDEVRMAFRRYRSVCEELWT